MYQHRLPKGKIRTHENKSHNTAGDSSLRTNHETFKSVGMKVMCIHPITDPAPNCLHRARPQVGDILNVREVWHQESLEWYVFQEYPEDDIFLTSRFAPLSSIDETELVNEKELAL